MNAPLAHGESLTDRRIYVSLWLLELCVALATASVGGGLLSLLFWAVLFALTLGLGADYAGRPTEAKRKRGEYVAAAGMVAFLYTLLSGGLEAALVVLVLWLLGALNATLATRRHGYFALAVSFVVVLFAASLSKNGLFLLIGVGYALACMYALLLLHAEGIRSQAAGVAGEPRRHLPASVVPLTSGVLAVAALLYLFVPRPPALMFGEHLDRGGVDYRNQAWEQQAKHPGRGGNDDSGTDGIGNQGTRSKDALREDSGSGYGTGAADNGDGGSGGAGSGGTGNGHSHGTDHSANPLAQANPFGRSQPSGNGGSRSRQHNGDFAGFSDRYDIDAPPGSKGLFNGIVLYVEAPQPLYLKGRVFDTFDGLSWRASRHGSVKHLLEDGSYRYYDRNAGTRVHQVITVAHTLPPLIPAAPLVAELRFPGSVFAEDAYGTLTLPRRLAKGTQYEVFSRREFVDGHPYTPATPASLKPYLQLPPDLDPRIGALAAQVTAGAQNDLDAAIALERYLRSHYQYTLATVAQQNHIPLAGFLFDTKRGHCEYFATAMTILLRTRGIPARLVTGFSATNYNPLTGYYEVRGVDGHAWSEAYLPPYGWVTFEATPFYDLPQPQPPGTTAHALDNYVQQLKRIAQQTDPHGSTTGLLTGIASLFTLIGQSVSHLLSLLRAALAAAGPTLLIVGTLLAIIGWIAYTLRRPLCDRWGALSVARAKPSEIAWIGYREMEGWFERRGSGRAEGETVEAYARRLSAAYPQTAQEIARIATLFVRQRYGGIAPDTDDITTIRSAFTTITSYREQQGGEHGKQHIGSGQ